MKIAYMISTNDDSVASKLGTYLMLALIIAYLVVVYIASLYVRWFQKEYDTDE